VGLLRSRRLAAAGAAARDAWATHGLDVKRYAIQDPDVKVMGDLLYAFAGHAMAAVPDREMLEECMRRSADVTTTLERLDSL